MRKYFFLLLLISTVNSVVAQSILKSENDSNIFEQIPSERVFVHFNTSLLFVGEYIYYKFYCFDSNSTLFSEISKIGYIELIGENGTIVFKHKITLDNGIGYGDFFIPSETPSGNYKLVAYTNWMKNDQLQNLFQNDVTVINPYQSNQKDISELPEFILDSITPNNVTPNTFKSMSSELSSDRMKVTINKSVFNKRDEIIVSIKSLDSSIIKGNYSMSVRKINTLPAFDKKSVIEFDKSNAEQIKTLNSELFLPELRGELVKGSILDHTSKKPIPNASIALSIPNEPFNFYFALTDDNGEFYVNIDKKQNGNKGYIEVLDKNRNNYNLELEVSSTINYSDLNFKKYRLSADMEKLILERSVHNQIENAFFNFRPDSTILNTIPIPFIKSDIITYNLDEYTRFSSVTETFIEIINLAWVEKIDQDNHVFKVKPYEKYADSNELPLVLIDGLIIFNHNDVLNLNAKTIKSISLLREKYIFGTELYKGIVSFETINGDYIQPNTNMASKYVDLFSPQPKKKYYTQSYTAHIQKESKLPDDRIQLLWIPEMKVDFSTNINCYTSDISGDFELHIEGFTSTGEPIAILKLFKVE